jgi:hypothetical protein
MRTGAGKVPRGPPGYRKRTWDKDANDVVAFCATRKYVNAADAVWDDADVCVHLTTRAAWRSRGAGAPRYDHAPRMNRTLIIIGILILAAGLLWKPLSALPLFRLPGDLVVDRPGFRFYFPFTSMLIISGVVSLILWLFRR